MAKVTSGNSLAILMIMAYDGPAPMATPATPQRMVQRLHQKSAGMQPGTARAPEKLKTLFIIFVSLFFVVVVGSGVPLGCQGAYSP